MKLLTFLSFSFVALTSLLWYKPETALAVKLGDQINNQIDASAVKAEVGNTKRKPQEIIAGIINVFLGLFGMMFLLLTILGGYEIFTAHGDSGKVEAGTNIIKRAIIGLGVVLAAYSLAFMFAKGIENSVSDKNLNKGPQGARYDQIF